MTSVMSTRSAHLAGVAMTEYMGLLVGLEGDLPLVVAAMALSLIGSHRDRLAVADKV